ncbi:hypothetical protein [Agrococcus carbonis]|uniref:UrcA family protein n=1 Tax=Agrococcus carbonis TaxID=684552 RepID=A0A1H1Q0S2_9MICO|nr:hypothetical protein [Agrococcus carbonis]SDS17131.1 hypothetical protein SAMN04489719_1702 [Agrococcus carbonis]
MHRIAAFALALLVLTGCATGEPTADVRNEVQTAINVELIPESIVEAVMDGDEAALEFVESMHMVSEQLTVDILDDDMCGSVAYRVGLNEPTLITAHERGCAVAAELGAR